MAEGNGRGGHVPKTYEVIKAWEGNTSVKIGGQDMRFGDKDAFRVKDRAKAEAIRQKYPGEVTVTEIPDGTKMEAGHNYFFSMPEAPWKKKERLEREAKEAEKDAEKVKNERQ